MTEKNTPTSQSRDQADKQQIVYMMPHGSLNEDEISIWKLILPLIEYKVQILLILILSIIAGVAIPAFYGVTLYRGNLVYQLKAEDTYKLHKARNLYFPKEVQTLEDREDYLKYVFMHEKDPSKRENYYFRYFFVPEKELFEIEVFTKFLPIVKKYWEVPETNSVYRSTQFLKRADFFVFKKNSFSADARQLTIATESPEKTIAAISQISGFFDDMNRDRMVNENSILSNGLRRANRNLNSRLIASIENMNDIRHKKTGSISLFYLNETATTYIVEQQNGNLRATKIKNKSTLNKVLNFNIKDLKGSMTDLPSLGEELITICQSLSDLDGKLADIRQQEQIITNRLYFEEKKRHNPVTIGGKINQLEGQAVSLSKQSGSLESKIKELESDGRFLYEKLEVANRLKQQLRNVPEGNWVDFIITKKSQPTESSVSDERMETEEKETAVLHGFDDFRKKLKENYAEMNRFEVTRYLYEHYIIKPIEIIEATRIATIEQVFALSSVRNKANKEKEEKPKFTAASFIPIKRLNFILLFSVVIGPILAVLSVFVRVFFLRIKSKLGEGTHYDELKTALKSWKL